MPLTLNLAQEAIAVLLDLAQRGEIDPWDVDAIAAIDRYLSKLGTIETPEPGQSGADLPQSGQAFLWASMLVLLKANTLERLENDEEEAEFENFDPEALEAVERVLPLHLERHIHRRPTAPPPRRRRVTLDELIEQIQEMAAVMDIVSARPPRDGCADLTVRALPKSRKAAAQEIAQLAHDENLTAVAVQLEQFLNIQLPQLIPDRGAIDLDRLLEWWTQATASTNPGASHPPSKSKDRVGVFWALLLLSAQSKVELVQEEFYQDLKIRPLIGQISLD